MRKSMRTVFALVLAALILAATPGWAGLTQNADLVKIEKVAGYYLNSGKTGDVDLLRKAFHPQLSASVRQRRCIHRVVRHRLCQLAQAGAGI